MDSITEDRSISLKVSDIFNVWQNNKSNNPKKFIFEKIISLVEIGSLSDKIQEDILNLSRHLCLKFEKKWQESFRNEQRFQQRNTSWLQSKIHLPESYKVFSKRERPQSEFKHASTKTKIIRVSDIINNRTPEEIQFAAELTKIPYTTKTSGLSIEKALALYLDLDLSENKYNLLRTVVNEIHKDLFPSLYAINQLKNSLLPSKVTATETSAEVDFQELIQKTTISIFKILDLNDSKKFKLMCKWGFDGSSGHSQYKQKFSDVSDTDEYLFLVAMVPLRLIEISENKNKDLWVNPRTSSTLYCRPIKFIFKKENPELLRAEEKLMLDKINEIREFEIPDKFGNICFVTCEIIFTLIDGAVNNVLSNTNSTQKCIICEATPREMNSVISRPIKMENYRFGLSTLHCHIRLFECLLHIGYRLGVKTWQVRGTENKQLVDSNKERIQTEFNAKMGLIVDKPKPGYGSTNDGNTARRFIENYELSSEITGINKNLIFKFSIILRVLSSGSEINLVEFKKLLNDTKQLYLELYSWYYIPNTVHKVLDPGCEIIRSFSLPIGQLSEDTLEARHKEVRKGRLSHTRKCSRIESNKDLIKWLLITSEPFIAHFRKVVHSKNNRLDNEEVQKYLTLHDT